MSNMIGRVYGSRSDRSNIIMANLMNTMVARKEISTYDWVDGKSIQTVEVPCLWETVKMRAQTRRRGEDRILRILHERETFDIDTELSTIEKKINYCQVDKLYGFMWERRDWFSQERMERYTSYFYVIDSRGYKVANIYYKDWLADAIFIDWYTTDQSGRDVFYADGSFFGDHYESEYIEGYRVSGFYLLGSNAWKNNIWSDTLFIESDKRGTLYEAPHYEVKFVLIRERHSNFKTRECHRFVKSMEELPNNIDITYLRCHGGAPAVNGVCYIG